MKIKKAKLEKLIKVANKYWRTLSACEEATNQFGELWDTAEKLFKTKVGAMFDVILGTVRVKPDVTIEDIANILEVLGYEVTE
jgi:hypothetical protein